MNILPKKRWHVRTKDNIARVRRDEAEARKKGDEVVKKLKFAESEARINFLRRQAGEPKLENVPSTVSSSSQHVNLFTDLKTHVQTTNKDYEKEQKEEREKYEKQIGYLTYLGQDTNEALKLRSWYEVAPKRDKAPCNTDTEKDMKNKFTQDPLTLINALLPPEQRTKDVKDVDKSIICPEVNNKICEIAKPKEHKKHKKEKKSIKKKRKKDKHKKRSKEKDKSRRHKHKKSIERDFASIEQKRREQKRDLINRLRKERLQREALERERQNALLKPTEIKAATEEKTTNNTPRIVQKYNSQFNPEIAKQNML